MLTWGTFVEAPAQSTAQFGSVLLVRVADSEDPDRFVVYDVATDQRSGIGLFTRLGEPAGGWVYYQWNNHPHSFVNAIFRAQKAASATHVGSTLFKGSVTEEAVKAAVPEAFTELEGLSGAVERAVADIDSISIHEIGTVFADTTAADIGAAAGFNSNGMVGGEVVTDHPTYTFPVGASPLGLAVFSAGADTQIVPALLLYAGNAPEAYRIVHSRGGTTRGTYPGSGQYFRKIQRFPSGYIDYVLSAESSDAPISVSVRSGDLFLLQKASQVTKLAVAVEDLAADALNRLLPTPAVGNAGKFVAVKSDGSGWEVVDAPGGGGEVVSFSNPEQSVITCGSARERSTLAFPASLDTVPFASATLEPSFASSLDTANDTVILKSGTYIAVFDHEVYTSPSNTTRYTSNDRFNIRYYAHAGANTFGEQINNPYFRPVPDGGQEDQYGVEHAAVLFRVARDASVGFRRTINGSDQVAYLATQTVTIYRLTGTKGDAGVAGPAGQKGDKGDTGARGPAGAQGVAGITVTLLASEGAYDALTTKNATTLYLWP